jgi:energy-converting hydrogenase Eha subunit F
LLGKLIKNDFKTQAWFFALLFAAALVLPVIVFLLTPDTITDEIQYTVRLLAQNLGPVAVVIVSIIFSAIVFAENFGGNASYLQFSIPAKTRSHIASKTIMFYVSFVLTIIFALIFSCLCDMDFSLLSDTVNPIENHFKAIFGFQGNITADHYVGAVCGILNIFAVPLILFGLIAATVSFGHLFGMRKKAASIGFVVAVIVIFSIYGVFHELFTQYFFTRVWMFPEGVTIRTLYIIRDIFDTVIMYLVIWFMFRFNDWVFTKKINLL